LAFPVSSTRRSWKSRFAARVGVHVAARRGLVHALDHLAQLAHLDRRDRLREPAPHELVEHRAQLVDLVRLADADLAHEHAAVLLEAHEAGALEGAERLADRAAGDAEEVGDARFRQLGAGREIAREDHPLDLLVHERRERARLHQADRGTVGRRVGRRRGGVGGIGHRAGETLALESRNL
jgi:hypothetical protein